jgi:serine/threonine protein kinase/Tol biopolymer transport system component
MAKLSPEEWRAISPQLDEALSLTDDERFSWLSDLRSQNRVLADQVHLLLAHHRTLEEDGFLQDPIGLPVRSSLAGEQLGAYTLASQIGAGGMGSVWLAERNDARFERKVAIKLLNLALIGRSGGERFQREGLILGRLAHPNIAELIDAGVSDAGQPYLVLEYIDGDHIDRYCAVQRLNIAARVRLFLQVLHAVEHAHANSIVHRDLKPSNILVRKDGRVKLLDFGIAKLLDADDQAGRTLTAGGRVMTPEYAAPEQMTGGAATPAIDIYALGVLLYLLFTGERPTGSELHSHSELVRKILEVEPRRPSEVAAPSLKRMLRGDLDTITLKALKKDPSERYESVEAFADDLHRYLRQKPIRARPDSIGYRTGKFVRRHKRSITAGVLATLALIGATHTGWRRQEGPAAFTQRRLTANPQDSPVLNAAVSPDGKYLGYGDRQGLHIQLIQTGETENVPPPAGLETTAAYWAIDGWHADSSRFFASVAIPGKPVSLWAVSIRSRHWDKLAEVEDLVDRAAISRDGSMIAYGRQRNSLGAREIWVAGSRGESAHRILTAEPQTAFADFSWSPAGNRIAFSRIRQPGGRREVSLESCDPAGADCTTIVRDNALAGFTWLPSGRLIYARATQSGVGGAGELWEVAIDEKHGMARGNAHRLADWPGSFIYNLNASADGKRLIFLRGPHHTTTLVGDLAAGGNRLINCRPLVADENINIVLAWTPDSKEVIFSSQHAATRQLFRQAVDPSGDAQLVTPVPGMNFYLARLSPDRAWLFMEGEPAGSRHLGLYRMARAGEVPQLRFPLDGLTQYWCSNGAGNRCVLGRSATGEAKLVISSFDASGSPAKELMRIPLEPGTNAEVGSDYSWQLSPNGLWIAILKRHKSQIRLISVRSEPERTVSVKDHTDLLDVNWAADSGSLYVSSLGPAGATLLHVEFNGNARAIWFQSQTTSFWGIPSPDGRHLAIGSEAPEANAWIIDNL